MRSWWSSTGRRTDGQIAFHIEPVKHHHGVRLFLALDPRRFVWISRVTSTAARARLGGNNLIMPPQSNARDPVAMGAKEEEDVDAGTPVEGKKLTFAERRELERKKKEARARDADLTAGRGVGGSGASARDPAPAPADDGGGRDLGAERKIGGATRSADATGAGAATATGAPAAAAPAAAAGSRPRPSRTRSSRRTPRSRPWRP